MVYARWIDWVNEYILIDIIVLGYYCIRPLRGLDGPLTHPFIYTHLLFFFWKLMSSYRTYRIQMCNVNKK